MSIVDKNWTTPTLLHYMTPNRHTLIGITRCGYRWTGLSLRIEEAGWSSRRQENTDHWRETEISQNLSGWTWKHKDFDQLCLRISPDTGRKGTDIRVFCGLVWLQEWTPKKDSVFKRGWTACWTSRYDNESKFRTVVNMIGFGGDLCDHLMSTGIVTLITN